jgi:hypothetical protein
MWRRWVRIASGGGEAQDSKPHVLIRKMATPDLPVYTYITSCEIEIACPNLVRAACRPEQRHGACGQKRYLAFNCLRGSFLLDVVKSGSAEPAYINCIIIMSYLTLFRSAKVLLYYPRRAKYPSIKLINIDCIILPC